MERLFTHTDLKRIGAGLAVAAAAGLLMGAAFRPDLDAHDAAGPQMLMGDAGPRKVVAVADPGLAAYAGHVPDYVIGSDWTRPHEEPAVEEAAAVDEHAGDVMAYENEAPPEVTRATYVDEPRPAPRYPSMSGNAEYEANVPAPPPPPADVDGEPAMGG